ncbi:MAG: hypothetical protein ACI4XG_31315 [Bradyrhizobium sp.]
MSRPVRLRQGDGLILELLRFGPFERRGGRWRFGTRPIADQVVARLIATGWAVRDGDHIQRAINGRRVRPAGTEAPGVRLADEASDEHQ